MNSRQYEKIMTEAYKAALSRAGIEEGEYNSVRLSADRTEYTVTMLDDTDCIIASGFEYFED